MVCLMLHADIYILLLKHDKIIVSFIYNYTLIALYYYAGYLHTCMTMRKH